MAVSTLLRRVGRLLTNPSEGDQLVLIGKGDRKPPKQVDMGNSGLNRLNFFLFADDSLSSDINGKGVKPYPPSRDSVSSTKIDAPFRTGRRVGTSSSSEMDHPPRCRIISRRSGMRSRPGWKGTSGNGSPKGRVASIPIADPNCPSGFEGSRLAVG